MVENIFKSDLTKKKTKDDNFAFNVKNMQNNNVQVDCEKGLPIKYI